MEQKAKDFIRQSLTRIGELAAHPAAFGVLLTYALLWFIFDRTTLDWHGFATLAAVFMTLIIQRAEDRDTQALQAKLDELLRASRSATASLPKSTRWSRRILSGLGMKAEEGRRPKPTRLSWKLLRGGLQSVRKRGWRDKHGK